MDIQAIIEASRKDARQDETPVVEDEVIEHSDPVDDVLGRFGLTALVEADDDDAEQHGVKGQRWGVRRRVGSDGKVTGLPGLQPRTGSADQIHQDRIQKKIDTVGVHSLSNTELQAYTRRIQMERDVKTALAAQSAAQQAKADGFIKSFVKKQGNRQADRFVNKALDVAFEAAVKKAGVKLEGNNPELGKGLQVVAKRMAPKKGG